MNQLCGSGLRAALILVGGGLQMLVFFPIGTAFGLFHLPALGFGWGSAGFLYSWGMSLALMVP